MTEGECLAKMIHNLAFTKEAREWLIGRRFFQPTTRDKLSPAQIAALRISYERRNARDRRRQELAARSDTE